MLYSLSIRLSVSTELSLYFSEIALPILAGPYGPLAKTIVKGDTFRRRAAQAKSESVREKNNRLLTDITTFEILGNLGLVPFYKDRRRARLKIEYQDKGPTISKSELKKLAPELYKQLYGD